MSVAFQEQRNVLVPMRDGVQLAADILRPAGGSRVPRIVKRKASQSRLGPGFAKQRIQRL